MMYFAVGWADLNTFAVVAVAMAIGIFSLVKGRADVWKSNYEGEKTRADNLQADLLTAKDEVINLNNEITKLKALPNVEKLYMMMERHEQASDRRTKETVKVLEAIAKKLQ